LNSNLKHLPDLYDRRLDACSKLESAETKLIGLATKAHLAAIQEASKEKAPTSTSDVERSPETSLTAQLERPTHRLGFLGLWGRKVDTIEWAREEIITCTELLTRARRILDADSGEASPEELAAEEDTEAPDKGDDDYPVLNSAFITFNKQIAAHMGAQSLIHHEPYQFVIPFHIFYLGEPEDGFQDDWTVHRSRS
jgi:calcium permeable stress-gated cation channel